MCDLSHSFEIYNPFIEIYNEQESVSFLHHFWPFSWQVQAHSFYLSKAQNLYHLEIFTVIN